MKTVAPFVFFLIFCSCAKRLTHRHLPFDSIVNVTDSVLVNLEAGQKPVRSLYMGCGHLIFRYRGEEIVFDPFFSTGPFWSNKIKSDTFAFRRYQSILEKHNFSPVPKSTVWLAHTHYDHMLDLPLLIDKGVLSPRTPIYGNKNGASILVNFIERENGFQYHVIAPEQTYSYKRPGQVPLAIAASPAVRVTPIYSSHAAHFKVIGPLKFHFMKGKANLNYFKKNYKSYTDVTSRRRWKEGATYSFLVDFLADDGSVAYRMFIQTSGSKFPNGNPPVLPDNRKVDVAFLCLASANFVRSYPTKMLMEMEPKKVVFVHWEDFFLQPLDFENARLVRMTNFRKVNRKLERKGLAPNKQNYFMPKPGSLLHFK